MGYTKKILISSCLYLLATLPLAAQEKISSTDAQKIAKEAYIYGYPLVTMDLTRQVMTNTDAPIPTKAPMGQFANMRTYPNASFRDVTAPNADTLYSAAWLDLSKEPYVFHVPNENGRYYLMPMLSGWTNVFADPGTRTTGTNEANFVITGPNWQGTLPQGLKEVKSPTNMVWVLGRTYSTGTEEDYKLVNEIQKQYSLTPLSSFGKTYTPSPGKVNTSIDMKTPVRDQVNNMPASVYFKRFAALLRENPPAPEDAEMVAKLAKIGIIPGKDFDISFLDPEIAKALEIAPKQAQAEIMDVAKKLGAPINGWNYSLNTGTYGTDYLARAYVTAVGLGANLPQDAVYPFTEVDENGHPLIGSNYYVLHFAKGETPPVDGFWSLTMYNDQYFFVDNSLNRYTLSPRNALKYNDDGSLDLYIQNESPGKDKESNWLPAPKGKFVLMLRLYWPKEAVLKKSWSPPAVEKT